MKKFRIRPYLSLATGSTEIVLSLIIWKTDILPEHFAFPDVAPRTFPPAFLHTRTFPPIYNVAFLPESDVVDSMQVLHGCVTDVEEADKLYDAASDLLQRLTTTTTATTTPLFRASRCLRCRRCSRCPPGTCTSPMSTQILQHQLHTICAARPCYARLCQISTNFDNFWHKNGEDDIIMCI